MADTFEGRKGKRTREQRIQELLRRQRSRDDRFGIGGREKAKRHVAPPITLPKTSADIK